MINIKAFAFIALLVIATVCPATLWAEEAKISHEDAMTIALETVNMDEVGEITSVELESDEGWPVYSVEFTKDGVETDVKINAQTGEVITVTNDLTEMQEEPEDQ